MSKGILLRLAVGTLVMGCLVSVSTGEQAAGGWLATTLAQVAEDAPAADSGWEKPIPVSFAADYTVVSDYIFRGVNFSEYSGEGGERCNQQLNLGAEVDLGEFGAIGGGAWFEWYSGNDVDSFNPDASGTLQEVDYFVYWSYEIPETGLTTETGWIAYTFPDLAGDAFYTNEWYVKLSYDDSKLFGTDGAVLNPYVAYYLDTDDVDGCWIETGVSHDFALADLGMADTPVCKDITVTPSFVLGIDKGQFDEGCHLHSLLYGLDVGYDLGSALNMPAKYGSLGVTGFLRFSQAINDAVIDDEFFGGVTLSYGW